MSDEEKIEQAANEYAGTDSSISQEPFKAGVQWRDQNPKAPEQRIQDIATAKDAYLAALRSPEVLALVEALENFMKGFSIDWYVMGMTERMYKNIIEAREALAAWGEK
jgi:hypothetical protein